MVVRLTSRFPQIAAELQPRADAAVGMAAKAIENEAKERVPVDTGTLRDAIHVERRAMAEYAVVAGDSEVYYAHIVEHGSVKTPPRPFLIPAAEAARDETTGLLAAVLRSL